MTDPFHIEGPAVISFSGGRTSGYMLWRILQAHGGELPDDVRVLFANTGKEMPETLDFVQECSERWKVPITWVEFRGRGQPPAVVDYASASRAGEPYELIITEKNYLPNPVARFCTVELKIFPMEKQARAFGFMEWDVAIGIRADEPRRWAKVRANPSGGRSGYERIVPLVDAGISAADVGLFWEEAPFDLRLPNHGGRTHHGNCDLCFLKGANQVLSLIRERPDRATWWIAQESRIRSAGQIKGDAASFRSDRPTYAVMHRMAVEQPELFPFADESVDDCACTD